MENQFKKHEFMPEEVQWIAQEDAISRQVAAADAMERIADAIESISETITKMAEAQLAAQKQSNQIADAIYELSNNSLSNQHADITGWNLVDSVANIACALDMIANKMDKKD